MGITLFSSGCVGYSTHSVNKDGVNPCTDNYRNVQVGLMWPDRVPVCSPKTCVPVQPQVMQAPPVLYQLVPVTPSAQSRVGFYQSQPQSQIQPECQPQPTSYQQLPQNENQSSDRPVLVSAPASRPRPGQTSQALYQWHGAYWVCSFDSSGQHSWSSYSGSPPSTGQLASRF